MGIPAALATGHQIAFTVVAMTIFLSVACPNLNGRMVLGLLKIKM